MIQPRHKSHPVNPDDVDAITERILRILVPLGGHKVLINRNSFSNDNVARLIGFEEWIDDDDLDFKPAVMRKKLREMHRLAESGAVDALPPDTLRANMARLAALGGLSDTDCRILEFAAMVHNDRALDDCADTLGLLNPLKVVDILSRLLDLAPESVRASLSAHGVLARSGLLALERTRHT